MPITVLDGNRTSRYWTCSICIVFCRTMWKKCCFSGDGEYICAGSARQHALYVWEKSIGNLVKILHGTKGELLLDVVVSVANKYKIMLIYRELL